MSAHFPNPGDWCVRLDPNTLEPEHARLVCKRGSWHYWVSQDGKEFKTNGPTAFAAQSEGEVLWERLWLLAQGSIAVQFKFRTVRQEMDHIRLLCRKIEALLAESSTP